MYGFSYSLVFSTARARDVSVCQAILLVAVSLLLLPLNSGAENVPPHSSVDRNGQLRVSSGMALHVNADLGSVRIETLPPNAPPVLRYTVHVETEAAEPLAQKLLEKYSLTTRETLDSVFITGALPSMHPPAVAHMPTGRNVQFWVQIVVTVPYTFSVDINTGGGDIETADLAGRVTLVTQGGNIRAGRIGAPGMQANAGDQPAAKIETQGGHIFLADVAGDVDAYTAGGHIQAGIISGNAKLRTGGGHVRASQIRGTARLETDGGNIAVGEAGGFVAVRTGGGQIDFGEVHGSVHAQTAGGGIRMMYVTGPMEVETSGGSICLTRVANTVRADTGEGTITAWITPDAQDSHKPVRLPGPSQLSSRTGDIVVFLPRDLALTVDATVENGGPNRIEVDPALPLNIQAHAVGPSHAMGNLNGGGAVLRLHTAAGKIRLKYLDEEASLRQSLLDEQRQRLAQKLSDASPADGSSRPQPPAPLPHVVPSSNEAKEDWFNEIKHMIEIEIYGGIHEDEKDFKKRWVFSPSPDYPQLAMRAGIQGRVRLQVRLKSDGTLSVEKVLEGEPALVDAATAAVQQWRATPEQFEGKNVDVISTVSFNFRPH
jgi:TonB family protein